MFNFKTIYFNLLFSLCNLFEPNTTYFIFQTPETLYISVTSKAFFILISHSERFITPAKSANSRSNSKYFGTGRGVTYYNYVSDQFTGFHGIVIPGTIRDSLYLLDGILEQETVLKPKEIMTDTAGYSDIIFGLFGLLGYQFSPRIADIGSSRFWKFDSDSDYGELTKLAKHKIRKDIIIRYWDDMMRVAGI